MPAGAELRTGIAGFQPLTEIGYDIRKLRRRRQPARFALRRWCIAVLRRDQLRHALCIGCASPLLVWQVLGMGLDRAGRSSAAAFLLIILGSVVEIIHLVFDEGMDTGPTTSARRNLDNIMVNGVSVLLDG